ncbi:MAG: hypothetical protein DIJKHBIC_00230 [Thermoanaerobaculia bacterium]|nr:hypothetical protein [Thermoanaerobaculia bacterium]
MQLEIRVTNGKIEIEPAPLKVRIQSVDGLTVAEPEEPAEPLTSEIVNQVLETLRGSRSTQ